MEIEELFWVVSGLIVHDRSIQLPTFPNIHIHTPMLFAGKSEIGHSFLPHVPSVWIYYKRQDIVEWK